VRCLASAFATRLLRSLLQPDEFWPSRPFLYLVHQLKRTDGLSPQRGWDFGVRPFRSVRSYSQPDERARPARGAWNFTGSTAWWASPVRSGGAPGPACCGPWSGCGVWTAYDARQFVLSLDPPTRSTLKQGRRVWGVSGPTGPNSRTVYRTDPLTASASSAILAAPPTAWARRRRLPLGTGRPRGTIACTR
jgi:hypothetical protein